MDGQVIEASSEHPFYVQGEWKETKNLDVGDKLTLFNQDCESSIASITIEARRDTVYNLSVADFETYFVSELGILVHNCGSISSGKMGKFSNAKRRHINEAMKDIKSGRNQGHDYDNLRYDPKTGNKRDSQLLPRGGGVTYKTHYVNKGPTKAQRLNGATHDKERIITGSDGSVWHTTDHYKTITKLSE